MPKTTQSDESRIVKACEATRREEKPNITKIAREFGVNRLNLHNRVKNSTRARSARQPVNKTLDRAHEEALTRWICQLNDWNMPPKPKLIEAWANRSLASAGKPNQKVGKMWVYRFIKRLPQDLQLGLVK